jgi:hypothetical protein
MYWVIENDGDIDALVIALVFDKAVAEKIVDELSEYNTTNTYKLSKSNLPKTEFMNLMDKDGQFSE